MAATAADWSATYTKILTAHGETVTVTRGASSTSALGRIIETKEDGLTDSIGQQTVKILVMAGLSFAPEDGDVVSLSAGSFRIVSNGVDKTSRLVAGTMIAYVLTAAG